MVNPSLYNDMDRNYKRGAPEMKECGSTCNSKLKKLNHLKLSSV